MALPGDAADGEGEHQVERRSRSSTDCTWPRDLEREHHQGAHQPEDRARGARASGCAGRRTASPPPSRPGRRRGRARGSAPGPRTLSSIGPEEVQREHVEADVQHLDVGEHRGHQLPPGAVGDTADRARRCRRGTACSADVAAAAPACRPARLVAARPWPGSPARPATLIPISTKVVSARVADPLPAVRRARLPGRPGALLDAGRGTGTRPRPSACSPGRSAGRSAGSGSRSRGRCAGSRRAGVRDGSAPPGPLGRRGGHPRSISTVSMTTGSTGRSPGPVAVVPIASTTSRLSWSATSPKMVCLLFSQRRRRRR